MRFSSPTVLIVGDRFAGFSTAHHEVQTIGEFLRLLRSNPAGTDGEPVLLRAGQGVTGYEWGLLQAEIIRHHLTDLIEVEPYDADLGAISLAHKHAEQNRLIAGVRRTDSDAFTAELRVHNDNELLLDHQTGQHVQGMVAVEAARQMFLAVTDQYFLTPADRRYFVIHSMETEFENFLFPLPAGIDYRITNADTADGTRLSFDAEIAISQGGRRSSLTRVRFTAFEEALIEAKEQRRADRAVSAATRPSEKAYADA